MAGGTNRAINKKKLFTELAVLLSIVLVIFLIRFIPWLVEQPVPWYDPVAKYQKLVNDVNDYDYSKGRDSKLETRLDQATRSINSNPMQYYYNQKAKAIYYYNVTLYEASLSALDMANDFIPSLRETVFVYDLYIKIYTALDQLEEIEKYKDLYDQLPL